jgi:excisionase family DNA binding protein
MRSAKVKQLAPNSAPAGNLSVREAAARLGVSPHTLRGWAKYQRRVPYLRLGRRLVFRPADLDAFEAACRVGAREEVGARRRTSET